MSQLVQLNKAYPEIQELGGELLAIHLECTPAGSEVAKKRAKLRFHLANDDRLEVATAYSPTSTYLVGLDGRISRKAGRRFDEIMIATEPAVTYTDA